MNLFRDILDKQILDRNKMKCGKADGLIMTVRPRARPQISHIELGSVTLARRLGPRPARFVARVARVFRGKQRQMPFRIEWNKVRDIGVDIEVEPEKGQCAVTEYHVGAYAFFERLSAWVIGRTILHLFGAKRSGYRVPWSELDLSDEARPKLKCAVSELRRLPG